MFTEFGLFRNSNFVTAYEHVANSYIDAYIYIYIFICCAFAGNSYQESKPGKEKHKSEVARNNVNIRITVSTWLGIPFNKYLETDGTIVIHKKCYCYNRNSVPEPLDFLLPDSLLGLSFALGDGRSFLCHLNTKL